MSEKNDNKKSKKIIKIITIFLCVTICIILLVLAGIKIYKDTKSFGITEEQINENEIGISETAEEQLEEYRNIAILGIDSRADDYGLGNRSDCMIIANINQKTKEIKLISVYRDTYMQVVENGTTKLDKVTHAYSFGGAQNALLALNTNLDLNIREYITVNFDAVIDIVDAVGGVSIEVDKDELKYINSYIDGLIQTSGIQSNHITTTGMQNLDGVQAVAYSRIRYTEGGDYKRTERMREVIEAIGQKVKTLNILKINNLIDVILPKVSTNIPEKEIITLIPTLLKTNFTESIGWPYTVKGITLDRWYGVPTTLESNVIRLHKEIFGDEDYVLPENIKKISESIVVKTGYREE